VDDSNKVLSMTSREESYPSFESALRVGKVVAADQEGKIFVDYSGNQKGPILARLTSSARENLRLESYAGREVLLGFEDDAPLCPIIIDTLHSTIDGREVPLNETAEADAPKRVHTTPKRLTLEAEEEVVLRCGDGSITITSAGKVLIKGKYLVSRSSGTNSIKGSSVRIN
jgi:hypothetical protein